MTAVRLNGFFPPDFVAEGRLTLGAGQVPIEGGYWPAPPVTIADARAAQDGADTARHFGEHGFVLLPHASAVRDWDNDVASIYLPEVEALIRERLLPGKKLQVMQQPSLLRRGRDTAIPFYAEGIHTDYGSTADDFQAAVAAFAGEGAARGWRMAFDRPEVERFLSIDFWRPTNMREPLRHKPLTLCDPGSLAAADVFPISLNNVAPNGQVTHHLALRYNPEQSWVYYPDMTNDEVLAFKLFDLAKTPEPMRACFHSAFEDPTTPADSEKRQSCEHRVAVFVLRD